MLVNRGGADQLVEVEAGAQGRPQDVHGLLDLRFRSAAGEEGVRTVVDTVEQAPPLRLIRGFPQADGSALVHLHNISGGILGGDQLRVNARIGPTAGAQVTTTGATRVYRHRPGRGDAAQTTCFQVANGGLLEYLPDPLIPFAGSRYRQATHFVLEDDGGLFAWDVVSPGREASGELFGYDLLALETSVTVCGQPILFERMAITPADGSMETPLGLGHFRSFATLLICRGQQPQATWSLLEDRLTKMANDASVRGQLLWGASTLVADGIVVRGLANEGRRLIEGLPHFWQLAKDALYGLPALKPRKIY